MAQSFNIDRVLFATDLSPACESALRCATAVARRFNAELYLLHVLPPRAPSLALPTAETSERHAEEAMGRLHQQLLTAHDKHTMAILSGDTAARILQKAKDVQADLIVMGTRAGSPRPDGLTDKIVRSAPCPVLAVPATRSGSGIPA